MWADGGKAVRPFFKLFRFSVRLFLPQADSPCPVHFEGKEVC